jgi:hypothetical protein
MQYGYGPTAGSKTSGVAIAALVTGLIGWVCPFVGSAIAAILGLIGIAITGKPGVTGRGMAIAGLLLGLLGIAGWGVGSYATYQFVRPMIELTTEVATLPQHQDFTKLSKWAGDQTTKDKLQTFTDLAKQRGGIKDVSVANQQRNKNTGSDVIDLQGTMTFGDGGSSPFSIKVQLKGTSFVITDLTIDNLTPVKK